MTHTMTLRRTTLAASVLTLAACSSSSPPAPPPSSVPPSPTRTRPLLSAVQNCHLDGDASAALGDDDRTLTLDGAGKEDTAGLTIEQIACVFAELHVTDAVVSHVDATRALDGMQSDTWPGFTARWTYHPDAGLDVTVQDQDREASS